MNEDIGFDPNTFMQTTVTEAMETQYTPIPTGDNYMGFIDDLIVRVVKSGDGRKSLLMDVIYKINDDQLKEKLKLQDLRVKDGIFLDVVDLENGNLTLLFGPNKNIGLGRLREVCGLNRPGQPFALGQLKGMGPLKLSVSIEPDKNDATKMYNRIKKVSKYNG